MIKNVLIISMSKTVKFILKIKEMNASNVILFLLITKSIIIV